MTFDNIFKSPPPKALRKPSTFQSPKYSVSSTNTYASHRSSSSAAIHPTTPSNSSSSSTSRPLTAQSRSSVRTTTTSVTRVSSVQSSNSNVNLLTPKKQMTFNSQAITVYLRLKPLKPSQKQVISTVNRQTVVCVSTSKQNQEVLQPQQIVTEGDKYKFDHVFDSYASQEEVFVKCAQPLVTKLVSDGCSSLLFAYGVTNAGKTYTMIGKQAEVLGQQQERVVSEVLKNRKKRMKKPQMTKCDKGLESSDGIIPRVLDQLFDILHQKSNGSSLNSPYRVDVSFLEIYNEQLYDLLNIKEQSDNSELVKGASSNTNGENKKQVLRLHEEGGRNVVRGLKNVPISNANEGIQLLYEGIRNRQVSQTLLNRDSSRSHALFTIKLLKRVKDSGDEEDTEVISTDDTSEENDEDDDEDGSFEEVGQFSIVDLAGVERAGRTQAAGERLKEASSINLSLTVLGKCMDILRQNQKLSQRKQQVVPFRESKLTRLIQDVMCKGKVSMIVNASPALDDIDETINVLKYATTAREVTTGSKVDSWRSPAHTTKAFINPRLLPTPSPQPLRNHSISAAPSTPNLQQSISFIEKQCYEQQIQNLSTRCEDLKQYFIGTSSDIETKVREEVSQEMRKQFTDMEDLYKQKYEADALLKETRFNKKYLTLRKTICLYRRMVKDREVQIQDLRSQIEQFQNSIQLSAQTSDKQETSENSQEKDKEQQIALQRAKELREQHERAYKKLQEQYKEEISALEEFRSREVGEKESIIAEKDRLLESLQREVEAQRSEYLTLQARVSELSALLEREKERQREDSLEKQRKDLQKDQIIAEKDKLLEALHREVETQRRDYFTLLDRANELSQRLEKENALKAAAESVKQVATNVSTPVKKKSSILGVLTSPLKNLKSPLKSSFSSKFLSPKVPKKGTKRNSDAMKDEKNEEMITATSEVRENTKKKRKMSSDKVVGRVSLSNITNHKDSQTLNIKQELTSAEQLKPESKTVLKSRKKKVSKKKKVVKKITKPHNEDDIAGGEDFEEEDEDVAQADPEPSRKKRNMKRKIVEDESFELDPVEQKSSPASKKTKRKIRLVK